MCMDVLRQDKQTWMLRNVDPLTIASIKVLAVSKNQSITRTLEQAVEYFCRKVQFKKDKPLVWTLPDDF